MRTAGSRSLPWQTSRGACCARTGGAGLAGRRARMPPAPPPQAPLAVAEGSGPSPLAAYRARAYAEQAQPRGLLDGYTPEGARAASMPGTGAAFHTCHSRAERPAAASASTGRRESQAGACGRLVGLHSLPITATPAALARSLRSIPRFSCLPVWGARAQARAWRADRVPSVAVPAAKGRHGRCRALKMRARPAALLRGLWAWDCRWPAAGRWHAHGGWAPALFPLEGAPEPSAPRSAAPLQRRDATTRPPRGSCPKAHRRAF